MTSVFALSRTEFPEHGLLLDNSNIRSLAASLLGCSASCFSHGVAFSNDCSSGLAEIAACTKAGEVSATDANVVVLASVFVADTVVVSAVCGRWALHIRAGSEIAVQELGRLDSDDADRLRRLWLTCLAPYTERSFAYAIPFPE